MSNRSRSHAGKNTLELIALDLLPIKEAHPEHTALVDKFGQIATPQYLWGVWSTATIIKRHSLWSLKKQSDSGLWEVPGETPEQRDRRVIEEHLRAELLRDVPFHTDDDAKDLLRCIYELEPKYFLETFGEGDAPATKELRTEHRITLKHVPTRYNVRALRALGVLTKAGTKERTFAGRLTEKEAAGLRKRRWVKSVEQIASTSTPPADNFDAVWSAKNKLAALLQETYGDEARLTVKDQPKQARLNVFLKRDGLQVMVTSTDAEHSSRPEMIADKTYQDFVSRIPSEVDGFPVHVRQWILDKSAVLL